MFNDGVQPAVQEGYGNKKFPSIILTEFYGRPITGGSQVCDE